MSSIPEKLIHQAIAAGANDAEVYQVSSTCQPVSFETNRLKQLETSESIGTALRLWHGNRPGVAVAYGEVDIEHLVTTALAIAELNAPETPELNHSAHLLDLTAPTPVVVETMIELGQTAIDAIRAEFPEVICNADLEWSTEHSLLMNSQGLHCEQSDNYLSYSVGAEWTREDDFLAVYGGELTKTTPDLPTVLATINQRLQWSTAEAKPVQGLLPVIFTPNAAVMFWEIVSDALNGKRIWEGSSPWAECRDKQVINPAITLTQQPDRVPYNCKFDDEGAPTQTLKLIESGQIHTFYCDRTMGRLLNQSSTGNGFRGSLGRYPSPSLVNMIVNSGNADLRALMKLSDRAILVDQILGGGPDISGDFSVNLDLGFLIDQGAVVGRLKDTMITGNVYDLLAGNLTLGSDREWIGSCYTPSLMLEALSVTS
jgi:PmbA protein